MKNILDLLSTISSQEITTASGTHVLRVHNNNMKDFSLELVFHSNGTKRFHVWKDEDNYKYYVSKSRPIQKTTSRYDDEAAFGSSSYSYTSMKQEGLDKAETLEELLETPTFKDLVSWLQYYKILPKEEELEAEASLEDDRLSSDEDVLEFKRETLDCFRKLEHEMLEYPSKDLSHAKRMQVMEMGGDDFAKIMLKDAVANLEHWLKRNKEILDNVKASLREYKSLKGKKLQKLITMTENNLRDYENKGLRQILCMEIEKLRN